VLPVPDGVLLGPGKDAQDVRQDEGVAGSDFALSFEHQGGTAYDFSGLAAVLGHGAGSSSGRAASLFRS
jgi:hypothetical protein